MDLVFSQQPNTIFDVMSGLARQHEAVNLGQGFPESDGPEDIRAEAAKALMNTSNQYPPMHGLPELRAAIAEHYGRFHGVQLDAASETFVTSGATEALAAAILGLVAPGDEVILIQPLYDAYLPLVLKAGGIPKLVRQTPPDWRITRAALEAAYSPKTRFLLFNNPQNPTGRNFRYDELMEIADFCAAHEIVAISDEVWEHVTFDSAPFTSLLALPSMRARCVKIGSAGKMFSLTGWKIGLVCAAPPLMNAALKAHQFLTFTTPPSLQRAVAYGLGKPAEYFSALRNSFEHGRDRLQAGLTSIGFRPLASEGTYFLGVDLKASGITMTDKDFCLRMVAEFGVAAIPFSAFYAADPVTHVIRLCFAKSGETIDKALERMAKARAAFAAT
jgi:aspartate/methionine/tyrosine aminotransferase